MMLCEVKTYGHEPRGSQLETLWLHHQLLHKVGVACDRLDGRSSVWLWHFGVCALSLEGVAPVDGTRMRWGVFGETGVLSWHLINVQTLKGILGFMLRPDNPSVGVDLRRHHKTTEIHAVEPCGFGFDIPTVRITRS